MHAEVVSANLQLGRELGVNGTPTVLVGGGDGQARRIGMGSDTYLEIAEEVDRLTAGLGGEAEESSEAEAEGSGG
jgi:hypothetical protein